QGSDIDLHLFADHLEPITAALDEQLLFYDVERKRVRKQGIEQIYTHVHVKEAFPVELTVYPAKLAHHVLKSSITGKPIERASLAELEQLLLQEYPELELESELRQLADAPD